MTIPREAVFSSSEFGARRNKVRQLMADRGIDTLLLHSAPNIYYLCGHHSLNLWDYQCLVLPLEQCPFMILWQFERGRFEASSVAAGLELFQTHADPIEETLKALRKHGLTNGTMGVESQTRYLVPKVHDALIGALEGVATVNGSGIVDEVRNIKSAAEIELMREAGRISDYAIAAGFGVIAPGATDSEIAAAVASELIRRNSLGFSVYPIVSVGYRAGMPHNSNIGCPVSEGDTVFIECSPSHHWYHAPIMRTAAVGEVPNIVREFGLLAATAVTAMLDLAKPGALASDLALAAERILAPVREAILFHEVYGYPVGIGFPPTWGEESGFGLIVNNHRPLEAGMVFHIPMTLRLNGKTGVGLSHTFAVTESSFEVFSTSPLELYDIRT